MAEQHVSLQVLDLRLKTTFTLSQKAADRKSTLIARWKSGLGEGAPSIHYGPTAEGLLAGLERRFAEAEAPETEAELEGLIEKLAPDQVVARCALEIPGYAPEGRSRLATLQTMV